jgi:hypothetical protein
MFHSLAESVTINNIGLGKENQIISIFIMMGFISFPERIIHLKLSINSYQRNSIEFEIQNDRRSEGNSF